MKQISLSHARRLAVHNQGLLKPEAPLGKEAVLQVIEQIGYVQIDTISVIERAHHHVLRSRVPDYHPEYLRQLEEKDRAVFEYWAHAASYLPIHDYRFTLPRKSEFLESDGLWFKKDRKAMEYVLDRIRSEGPLMSKDFKPVSKNKPSSTGMDWAQNPMNLALRQLFMEGRIMVSHRRGFQKVYDLPENILPDHIDTRMPSPEEYYRHLIDRDIRAHGLVKSREIGYLLKGSSTPVNELLGKMKDAGEIEEVKVGGIESDTYFSRPDYIRESALPEGPPKLTILSPFDNLVIQRQRLEELFGFKYILECYVPAAKRRFGYFSLPLLWGIRFAGQVDLKADRKNKVLLVRNLELAPDLSKNDELLSILRRGLHDFAVYNKCKKVETTPELAQKFRGIFD